ncbi:hypothetical protein [uncultured Intestinimonas sp.]|uniref:hypothetical protein n=1 Tax=uncultured Intestinimonas sp. TaxID=1689265 RepID=UPI0025F5C798|nr:hypothetical protein [uncultured Intestinimonas sp.]
MFYLMYHALFPMLGSLLQLLEGWLAYLYFLADLGEDLLALVTGLLPLPLLTGVLLTWIGCIFWYHRGDRW